MSEEYARLDALVRRTDLCAALIRMRGGFAQAVAEEHFLANLAGESLTRRLQRVSSAELSALFRRDVAALLGGPY